MPLFEFFWAQLPDDVPALIADHGAMLPVLVARLEAEGELPTGGRSVQPAAPTQVGTSALEAFWAKQRPSEGLQSTKEAEDEL